MKVLKFGGTSVGSPERMRQVANIISRHSSKASERKIVVLSALAGTTNALVAIGEALRREDTDDATTRIGNLYEHYLDFHRGLLKTDRSRDQALSVIDRHFDYIRGLLKNPFDETQDKELLAQGELLSTALFSIYLDEAGLDNQLIAALDFMAIDEHDEPDLDHIRSRLLQLLEAQPDQALYITQGFICLNPKHQIDNLKRGGSDYTASLIGAALRARRIEIWTDIDGMHNNDPRVVDNTVPIADLSFNEASELAYFGAKILHPSSILPARKYNIPVHLKNTMAPDAHGTRIHAIEDRPAVKAIAAKDDITAINIKSSRMLLAYGFLRKIFEVFEKYRTPIDMITTSEVAVSLTIDDDGALESIIEELAPSAEITIDRSMTIICIVGNRIADQKGIVRKTFQALDRIPIRMISYGGSNDNISVLVDKGNKVRALQALNEHLFDL